MRFPRLPRVIGHRGAALHAPENTLAGFAAAAQLGVHWIEMDVQLAADGVPVVFHDDRLERTTDGAGRLTGTPSAELFRLDAGAWFAERFAGQRIPALTEALAFLTEHRLGVCLEVKAGEAEAERTARAALAEVRRLWPAEAPLLLSSFTESALAVCRDLEPARPRGLLVERLADDWRSRVRRLGCESLHIDHLALDEDKARAVRQEGLRLLAYTVNERSRAEQLWGWGVDAVFSDCPDRLAG